MPDIDADEVSVKVAVRVSIRFERHTFLYFADFWN
jgi:hypothetical protein